MTFHCWRCGWQWGLSRQPGRSETCPECRSDLRVCLNCVSYDKTVAYQCRDRRADQVPEKDLATFCEYFEFVRRNYVPPQEEHQRADQARDALKKLFGD